MDATIGPRANLSGMYQNYMQTDKNRKADGAEYSAGNKKARSAKNLTRLSVDEVIAQSVKTSTGQRVNTARDRADEIRNGGYSQNEDKNSIDTQRMWNYRNMAWGRTNEADTSQAKADAIEAREQEILHEAFGVGRVPLIRQDLVDKAKNANKDQADVQPPDQTKTPAVGGAQPITERVETETSN